MQQGIMHKNVIIIGGGISGIKTALDLYNNNIKDTLILEARDRLGGRILSVKGSRDGVEYDLGASWFHDSLVNPMFEKAIKKGNISYYLDDGKHTYYSKDSVVSNWEFDSSLNEFITYTRVVYEKYPNKLDQSLKDLFLEYVKARSSILTEKEVKYTSASARMWAELWHGIPWEKLSGKYTFDSEHLGRNVLVTSGYINAFNNELYDLPKEYRETNIKLNSQVTEINYKGCENFAKKIQIKTSSSEIYTCDYLVVTIPQSLLKVTDSLDPLFVKWVPELPSRISTVLLQVQFGSLGKVVLEFPSCFWPKDVDRFYMISNEVPLKKPRPWDYPAIILNFQAIAGVPSLLLLIQSPLIEYIEELDTKSKNDSIWSLFEPMVKRLALSDTIKPSNIYSSSWTNDIFSKGTYATTLTGDGDSNKIAEIFSSGLNERIRYAGAETIKDSANGCAHGGWLSGEREALYITNSIKSKTAKF